jgi:CDP-glucose 4,6-dehydratase
MLENTFRGRRVLVTGHTGFKGGWLVIWLRQLGAQVTGVALEPQTTPSLFKLADVTDGIDSHILDIRDQNALASTVAEAQPEIVFHLAAQPIVRRGYSNPIETYGVNVLGTVNVLEAVRAVPDVLAVVCITSDKCYLNSRGPWAFRETDPLGGSDPYSSSKAGAELVCAAYCDSYFLPNSKPSVATARSGNVIGGGDWSEDRLVPDFVRAVGSATPLLLRNPMATRPWQHVLEPTYGYLKLAAKLLTERPTGLSSYNFGPRDDATVTTHSIVERLTQAWGAGSPPLVEAGADPSKPEAPTLRLDSGKAWRDLQWRGILDLADALGLTADWYKAALAGRTNMRRMTEQQVAMYSTRVA